MSQRYWNNRYDNDPHWFDEKSWMPKYCSVPGHIGDQTYRCLEKFEKWYKRPRRSHQLYWKLHK